MMKRPQPCPQVPVMVIADGLTSDRRAYERIRHTARIVFEIADDPSQEPFEGFTQELSRYGLSAALARPLAAEASVVVRLERPDGTCVARRRAHLKHSRAVIEGLWVAGLQFELPLATQELNQLTR